MIEGHLRRRAGRWPVPAAYTGSVAGSRLDAAALNADYHAAFLAGAGCVVLGALIVATLLLPPKGAGPQ